MIRFFISRHPCKAAAADPLFGVPSVDLLCHARPAADPLFWFRPSACSGWPRGRSGDVPAGPGGVPATFRLAPGTFRLASGTFRRRSGWPRGRSGWPRGRSGWPRGRSGAVPAGPRDVPAGLGDVPATSFGPAVDPLLGGSQAPSG